MKLLAVRNESEAVLSPPPQVRIKCRDYVKKIAVYKDRLAVQLPDKVRGCELVTGRLTD